MAPSFNVVGRFVADVSNFMRGVTQVGRASRDLSKEMDDNARMVRKLQQESERVTATLGKLRQAQEGFVTSSRRATDAMRQEQAVLQQLARGYRDLDDAQRQAGQRAQRTASAAERAGRAAGGSSGARTAATLGAAGVGGLGIYKLLQSISDKGVGSTASGVGKGFEGIGAGALKAAMGLKEVTSASAGWARQRGVFGVVNASLDQTTNAVTLLRRGRAVTEESWVTPRDAALVEFETALIERLHLGRGRLVIKDHVHWELRADDRAIGWVPTRRGWRRHIRRIDRLD